MKMNIGPEESFNQHLWRTMQKLKKGSLYPDLGTGLVFREIDARALGSEKTLDEMGILSHLFKWKAVKMHQPSKFDESNDKVFLYIELLNPVFENLYTFLENAFKQDIDPKRLFVLTRELVVPTGDKNAALEINKILSGASNKSKITTLIYNKELRPEMTVGDLASYSDGTIRHKDKVLGLRSQLKDLCRLFMAHPKRLLTIDDIKAEIVPAEKRGSVSFATISKYVSELHSSLKIHFRKRVIFNEKKEGWYLDITKS